MGSSSSTDPATPQEAGRQPGRAWTATSLKIDVPGPVHAGVDGESVDLSPPLEFVIVPAALRVRISSRHPAVSPSGRVRPQPRESRGEP